MQSSIQIEKINLYINVIAIHTGYKYLSPITKYNVLLSVYIQQYVYKLMFKGLYITIM